MVKILISSLASAGERHPKYIACPCFWAIMLHFFNKLCEPQILLFLSETQSIVIRNAKTLFDVYIRASPLGLDLVWPAPPICLSSGPTQSSYSSSGTVPRRVGPTFLGAGCRFRVESSCICRSRPLRSKF